MKYFVISDDEPPLSQSFPEYIFKSRVVPGKYFGSNKITQELKEGDEIYTMSDIDGSVRVYTVYSPVKSETISIVTDDICAEPIKVLKLRPRLELYLKQLGISTIGHLMNTTRIEMLKKPNIGRRSINEIDAALTTLGLPTMRYG